MQKQNVNIIKADHSLQLKVGKGPMDEKAIRASQEIIDKNEVDFGPLALAFLDDLEEALESAKDPSVTMSELKTLLIKPVMQLKANAAIFHYSLVGSLAGIMLGFLEAIKVMDSDAIEIVRAHHKSLHMIVVRKMSGDGGEAGKHLMAELQSACERYYSKKFAR